ncbi:MAG: N-acetylmuramoyl-L-alanine amidase [Bryobacteraceae bacterium]
MATAQSHARLAATLTVAMGVLPALSAQAPSVLKDVRFWSSRGVTRVALETSGEARFEYNRLRNPDRVYVDLFDVRPKEDFRGLAYTVPVNDGVVTQIRVAPNRAGVTRVVLDLDMAVEVHVNQLTNPDRVVVEVRQVGGVGDTDQASTAAAQPPTSTAPTSPAPATSAQPARVAQSAPAELPVVLRPSRAKPYRPPPPIPIPNAPPLFSSDLRLPKAQAPKVYAELPRHRVLTLGKPPIIRPRPAPTPPPAAVAVAKAEPPPAPITRTAPNPVAAPPPDPALEPMAAERTRGGNQSLTRALGLKLNRVVLDAGHGGRDQGTATRSGLLEKELVLDVTMRLGRLLEEAGTEVIYTRSKDVYVPLERRSEIANEKRADLFLSIHANASSLKSVAGVETFYLSFTSSQVDMDLAARENAASEKSIHELSDLVRKIAQHDKIEESREFAARIQRASHELSVRANGRSVRNRGVKKAPLVVLIGASMPSVLTEIGFISNPKEEALLKKADHRQRIADALYKGIVDYSNTLSRFRVARRGDE